MSWYMSSLLVIYILKKIKYVKLIEFLLNFFPAFRSNSCVTADKDQLQMATSELHTFGEENENNMFFALLNCHKSG